MWQHAAVLVVGLTGGIGVGKTTVARLLEKLGAIVVDCDGLGRLVVEPGGRAYEAVLETFGHHLKKPDGTIDRPGLAAIVFNDPGALAVLNSITHPAIDAEIAVRLRAAPADAIVVLDMAVLVETKLGEGQYEVVVVVEAPVEVRLERLAGRGMNREDALARMASQATDEQRRAKGDLFVTNGGTEAELAVAVDALWADLQARAAAR